jgi:hypothetical protein
MTEYAAAGSEASGRGMTPPPPPPLGVDLKDYCTCPAHGAGMHPRGAHAENDVYVKGVLAIPAGACVMCFCSMRVPYDQVCMAFVPRIPVPEEPVVWA